nr:hypothetical protein CFP56_45327 [Quercus suber]
MITLADEKWSKICRIEADETSFRLDRGPKFEGGLVSPPPNGTKTYNALLAFHTREGEAGCLTLLCRAYPRLTVHLP